MKDARPARSGSAEPARAEGGGAEARASARRCLPHRQPRSPRFPPRRPPLPSRRGAGAGVLEGCARAGAPPVFTWRSCAPFLARRRRSGPGSGGGPQSVFVTVAESRQRLRRSCQDRGLNASRAPSWLAPPRFPPGICGEAEARRADGERGSQLAMARKEGMGEGLLRLLSPNSGLGVGWGGEGCCGEVEAAGICPYLR